MIYFLSFYCTVLLISIIGQYLQKYQQLIWGVLLFVVTSFVGLRDGIGQDYDNYEKIYNNGLIYDFNYGGLIFNYLLIQFKSLNIDFSVFIYLSSAVYFSVALTFIYKYTENKFLAVVLYILFPITFLSSISGIRQGWALSLMIISLLFYFKGNKWLFLMFSGLSLLFHATVIVFYLFFFTVRKLRISTLIAISSIVLTAVWFVLPQLQSIMPMGRDYLNYKTHGASLSDILMVCVLALSTFGFVLLQRLPDEEHSEFFVKASLVGCILVIFSKLSGVMPEPFMRLAIYFLWCYPIFISDSLLKIRMTASLRLMICIAIIVSFICYSVLSINTSESLTPYVMKAII